MHFTEFILTVFSLISINLGFPQSNESTAFRVGVGKSDITGPIGEINMMGYAMLDNTANGVHLRLQSRAFILASPLNPNQRIVYVSTDTGQVSHSSRNDVARILKETLNSNIYSVDNIMISATHTHSGPGGYLDELLYHITSSGVVKGERSAITNGIVDSILKAHKDFEASGSSILTLHEGINYLKNFLFSILGELLQTSVNRSPSSYELNPPTEKQFYGSNTDKLMSLIKIHDNVSKKLKGSVNWFSVHGTSMNNKNAYVSGDNKGYASYMLEEIERQKDNLNFVGAFAQTNSGDVSPNTDGAKCSDTGVSCDGSWGDCGGDITKCFARGPGFKEGGDFLSAKIIGGNQFKKALELQNQGALLVLDRTEVKTCKPAMGHSFAAGTTDGPGTSLASQGANSTAHLSKLLDFAKDLIKNPSAEQEKCQAPKQILLDTGEITWPYAWQPTILPLQLFVIGRKLAIIGFPSEITTMAGRRLKKEIFDTLRTTDRIDPDARIILSALTNAYASYVTTFEEYQAQRYEASSTIFGPHTLNAYIDQYKAIALSISNSQTKPSGATQPPVKIENPLQLLPDVVLDTVPIFKNFGDVQTQPVSDIKVLSTVTAVFHCSHPRTQDIYKSFFTIEKFVGGSEQWITFLDDSGWDTKMLWKRVGVSESLCQVDWSVGETRAVPNGIYRIHYYGKRSTFGALNNYEGITKAFTVSN
ncbi:hypothetical protein HK099_003539 [Clydaea vesicula]|uniref:Neutral ceramidase n=1 Tax=Clydaea vesicula TaxID=447962 RepID=A0AAD5U1Q5_9FUNG|nr:hypothetical protein HK099_003539 [Clydaea vesicula]